MTTKLRYNDMTTKLRGYNVQDNIRVEKGTIGGIVPLIIPTSSEVVKNRTLGMPITRLTRHQRVAFSGMIKVAYTELIKNNDQQKFTFPTKEFIKMLGIDIQKWKYSSLFVKHKEVPDIFSDNNEMMTIEDESYAVEKTLNDLLGKEITMRYKNIDGIYEVRGTVLLSDFKMNRETTEFSFGQWVRDSIITGKSVYISKMEEISKLKSTYAVALFDQIEQRKKFKEWRISVLAFRTIMGIEEGKYKRFTNLRTRVIDTAIKEIELLNSEGGYNLSVDTEKTGRKITKIIFKWSYKEQTKQKPHKKENQAQEKDIGSKKEDIFEYSEKIRNISKQYKLEEEDAQIRFGAFKVYHEENNKMNNVEKAWEYWIMPKNKDQKQKKKQGSLFSFQDDGKNKEYEEAIKEDEEIRNKIKIGNIEIEDVLSGDIEINEVFCKYIPIPKGYGRGERVVFFYKRNHKEEVGKIIEGKENEVIIEAEII